MHSKRVRPANGGITVKQSKLLLMVRTALLLAVTLLMQSVRFILPAAAAGTMGSTLLIGSLVNAALAVSAGVVGWRGSVVIAIVTPVVALLQGHLALPVLIPFVAAGNIALVLPFEALYRRESLGTARGVWAALVSSVVKSVVLYLSIAMAFVRLILPALGLPAQKVTAMSAALSLNFSWPQLVTALIGTFIALPVLAALARARRSRD